MRDYRDAKAMAQTLRQALKERSVSLTHSESLELIAKVLGFADWNVLSARIQAEQHDTIKLPVVPMRDFVLFPQATVPLWASRVKTVRAIGQAMTADKQIFVVTQRRFADDDPKAADLYEVGVITNIVSDLKLEDGTTKLIVRGLRRARIERRPTRPASSPSCPRSRRREQGHRRRRPCRVRCCGASRATPM